MQVAEATLKKANNKISETESIESLLRKGGVRLGFRAAAGTISDEELNRIKDDMLSAITSYDDQVKIAKRSIPKTTKPKAKAKAAA